MNPSDAEVDTLKKEIDEDDSGDIDFQEFLELMNSTTLRYKSSLNDPDKRTGSSVVIFESSRLGLLLSRNMQAVDDRESRLRTALQVGGS